MLKVGDVIRCRLFYAFEGAKDGQCGVVKQVSKRDITRVRIYWFEDRKEHWADLARVSVDGKLVMTVRGNIFEVLEAEDDGKS